jgi:hypothetical protein
VNWLKLAAIVLVSSSGFSPVAGQLDLKDEPTPSRSSPVPNARSTTHIPNEITLKPDAPAAVREWFEQQSENKAEEIERQRDEIKRLEEKVNAVDRQPVPMRRTGVLNEMETSPRERAAKMNALNAAKKELGDARRRLKELQTDNAFVFDRLKVLRVDAFGTLDDYDVQVVRVVDDLHMIVQASRTDPDLQDVQVISLHGANTARLRVGSKVKLSQPVLFTDPSDEEMRSAASLRGDLVNVRDWLDIPEPVATERAATKPAPATSPAPPASAIPR